MSRRMRRSANHHHVNRFDWRQPVGLRRRGFLIIMTTQLTRRLSWILLSPLREQNQLLACIPKSQVLKRR